MSTVTIFLLTILGLLSLIIIIVNPFRRLFVAMEGKTADQLQKQAESWLKTAEPGVVCSQGCLYISFFVMAMIFAYIVEPLVVIFAIVNKLGYLPVAYTMAAIIVIGWIQALFALATYVMNQGKEVDPNKVPIKPSNRMWAWIRRGFFALPTFYIFYLVLVGLGILP